MDKTLAALDVGTNSCRLLIADVCGGIMSKKVRRIKTTRVGRKIMQTGCLDREGIKASLAVLREWRDLMAENAVDDYRLVATSAVRDAANGEDFRQEVRRDTGLELEIISGEREAYLSYLGVKRGLACTEDPLVVDLGGGSTEFIYLGRGQSLVLSLPLGVVRSFDEGWGGAEYCRLLEPVRQYAVKLAHCPVVMVGGTATTLAAIDQKMEIYNERRIQGHRLSEEKIETLAAMLRSMGLAERRQVPGLLPDRADIIPVGADIVLAIMQALGRTEIMVGDSDLLEGLIWEMSG